MALKPLKAADVKFLVVHCSATPPLNNVTAADIDRWHRDKGWIMLGYHFVIRRDGTLEKGRPLTMPGAHVEGYNSQSLGICMVGGVDEKMRPQNNFSPAQFRSLEAVLRELRFSYPTAEILGHKDFPGVAKACPSFSVREWAKDLGI